MAYTWSQFVTAVNDMLTVDAKRAGIDKYRTAVIRQAVIKIQTIVEGYTKYHESLYYPGDLVMEGMASRGTKPPESNIESAFIFRVCVDQSNQPCQKSACVRHSTDPWPWRDRFALVKGVPAVNSGKGYFSIDPEGYEFMVYPAIYDCHILSINWSGKKLDFKDDEETPFDEPMVMAVAEYVQAKIARKVDRDLAMHESFMGSFALEQRDLYLALRDKKARG